MFDISYIPSLEDQYKWYIKKATRFPISEDVGRIFQTPIKGRAKLLLELFETNKRMDELEDLEVDKINLNLLRFAGTPVVHEVINTDFILNFKCCDEKNYKNDSFDSFDDFDDDVYEMTYYYD